MPRVRIPPPRAATMARHSAALAAALLSTLALAGFAPAKGRPVPVEVAAPPAITGVEIGFGGKYKPARWTPIWVTLAAGDAPAVGRLEVVTPDSDGVDVVYVATSPDSYYEPLNLQLAAGEVRAVPLLVRFSRLRNTLTVIWQGDDGRRAERRFAASELPPAVMTSQTLVVTVGDEVGVAAAVAGLRRGERERMIAARVDDLDRLPVAQLAYEGVDVVVANCGQQSALFTQEPHRRRLFDLTFWMEQGGRAILFAAEPADVITSQPPSLRQLAPGEFDDVGRLRSAAGLETFVGAAERLQLADQGLAVSRWRNLDGRVLAAENVGGQQVPTLVRRAVGFGVVTFVTLDLDAEPLRRWADRPRLLQRLLVSEAESTGDFEPQRRGRASHIGFDDLSGQLRSALDQFGDERPALAPFSWVAGLMVLYILVIGPGDWLLVRFGLRRMELTWVTFPLAAMLFAAIAWGLGGWSKPRQLAGRQVAVIDVDYESKSARGFRWLHLYSSQNRRYDLACESPDYPGLWEHLTWQGLPGDALGGVDVAAPVVVSPAPAYEHVRGELPIPLHDRIPRRSLGQTAEPRREPEHVDGLAPHGLPIAVGATKSLLGKSNGVLVRLLMRPPSLTPEIGLTAAYEGQLTGEFRNPLEIPLTDCVLLHDRWAYEIGGVVGPNETVRLAEERDPRDLEWRMTRRRVDKDNKPVTTPWNPASLDVPEIVDMMLFHEAAGGRQYTRLRHRLEAGLDLSDHLRLGRAVLVGRAAEPASVLAIDGQQLPATQLTTWTWYRIVYRVAPRQP